MYYTKYRPQKFSDISKPNDTAHALMSQLKNGNTAHAYLFVGSRGTGKTTTARILAKALDCTNLDKSGDPCLECENCKSIIQGKFVDLIEIDAASNRGIDDIRDLKNKIKLAPSIGPYKVYIIDEVHMLTTEAFNALLKTLEEPPKHVVFVLCTTEMHKIPETIKSRCQVFKFKRATRDQIVRKLETICKNEGVKNLTTEDLQRIADASFGGFRDAETLLQQVVEGSLDPKSFIGVSAISEYASFSKSLFSKECSICLAILRGVVDDGTDLNSWGLELVRYLRDVLLIKSGVDVSSLDLSEEVSKDMTSIAKDVSLKELVSAVSEFSEALSNIKTSSIPQLPLEIATIKTCNGIKDDDINTNFPKQPSSNSESKDNGSKKANLKVENPSGLATAPVISGSVDVIDMEYVSFDFDYPSISVPSDGAEDDELMQNEEVTLTPAIEISAVIEKWPEIVGKITTVNTSLYTLLKKTKPVEVVGSRIIIEVCYKFHKERLESNKYRKMIEDIVNEVLNVQDLTLECNVNPDLRPPKRQLEGEVGELTDHNVSALMTDASNLGDIFDGGLPL